MNGVVLSSLTIRGIGPFEDATIDLEKATDRIVLFEGPNGCGKSTIAQLIAAACGDVREYLLSPQATAQRAGIAPALRLPTTEPDLWYPQAWDAAGSVTALESLAQRSRTAEGGFAKVVFRVGEETFERTYSAREFQPFNPTALAASPLREFVAACGDVRSAVRWAAFAYRAHQATPVVETTGPRVIRTPAMRGALGFGDAYQVGSDFGQLLTNLENEHTKAFTYAHETEGPEAPDGQYRAIADQRKQSVHRVRDALSTFLDRRVEVTFPIGQQSPHVTFDRVPIPFEVLGEGMRSSIAWLGDLLVRLERQPWADTTTSPLDRAFWLILDEIDESLHPQMQSRIYPALLKLFPNARIYATTHSPFVVASVGKGTVVPIRPNPRTHGVSGQVQCKPLQPGQSLELIVRTIFDTDAGIIDEETRRQLAEHGATVLAMRQKVEPDWTRFLALRRDLYQLNDEVKAIVAIQELPVREAVEQAVKREGTAIDAQQVAK